MPIQFIEDPEPVKLKEDVVANSARNNLGIRGLTAEMVKAGMGKSELQGPDTPGFWGSAANAVGIPTSMEQLKQQSMANLSNLLLPGSSAFLPMLSAKTPMEAVNNINPMSTPMTQLGEGNWSGLAGTAAGAGAMAALLGRAGGGAEGGIESALAKSSWGEGGRFNLLNSKASVGNMFGSPVEAVPPPEALTPPTWGQNAASELGNYFKRKIPGYDAIKTASNIVKGPKQPSAAIPEPSTSGLAKLSLADPGVDPSNLPAIPGAGLRKPMPSIPNPPSTPLSDIYSGQVPPTASASIGLANPDSFLSKVTSGYDSTNPQITNSGQDVSPPFMGDAEFGMAENGTATPPRNVGNKFLSSTPDPTKNIIGSKEEYLHADDAKPGRILKRSPVVESEHGQSGGEPLVRVDSITPDKQAAIVSSKTKDGTWIQKTVPIRRFDLKPPKH